VNNIFNNKSLITQISLITVLVYAAASAYLLIVSVNWYEQYPDAFRLNPRSLVGFSIISFLLVALVSAYHLNSLLRRRKRRSDRARLSRARFIRAKHRLSRRSVS
jgi:putative effector of murein hydrolase LrgA (UPF0299 family)